MEVNMSTFDWYGNRVVTQPTVCERQSTYLQLRKVCTLAWMRLGLGLIGENMSDYP